MNEEIKKELLEKFPFKARWLNVAKRTIEENYNMSLDHPEQLKGEKRVKNLIDVRVYSQRYEIADTICRAYGVLLQNIQGKKRTALYVQVRREIAKALRDNGFTLKMIGNFLGGRDHSTIIALLKSKSPHVNQDGSENETF